MSIDSQSIEQEESISFRESAVAFLDILGFKDFIKKAETPDSEEFRAFCDLLRTIEKQVLFVSEDGQEQHRFPSDVELAVLHISDSLVLSAPVTPRGLPTYNGLVAVSIKAIQLAHQLLKMGFLLRGGVAVGPVYRMPANIFGTGYQAAFETEQAARMPRILLHKSAEAVLESGLHSGVPLRIFSIFMKEGTELDPR